MKSMDKQDFQDAREFLASVRDGHVSLEKGFINVLIAMLDAIEEIQKEQVRVKNDYK